MCQAIIHVPFLSTRTYMVVRMRISKHFVLERYLRFYSVSTKRTHVGYRCMYEYLHRVLTVALKNIIYSGCAYNVHNTLMFFSIRFDESSNKHNKQYKVIYPDDI